jgi:NADH:ubiquinone oxidoreductase subunit E
MHDDINLTMLDEILKKYDGEEGALIPILQEAQDMFGRDESLIQITSHQGRAETRNKFEYQILIMISDSI